MAPVTQLMQLEVDDTTVKLIAMLRDSYSKEPEAPNLDRHDGHVLQEIALKHYEWERQVSALRLLVSVRLVNLALEDPVVSFTWQAEPVNER
jgi:hypothetical protein